MEKIFEKGKYYVIWEKYREKGGKFIESKKNRHNGKFLHVIWFKTRVEELIPQSWIEREANEEEYKEIFVRLI